MATQTQPRATSSYIIGLPCSRLSPMTQAPPWMYTMTGRLLGRGQAGAVDVEAVARDAVAPVVDVAGRPRTARDLNGMARVTRHQRPHVGAVGSVGTGKASLRTSSRAAAVTPAARRPAMPSPSEADPVDDGDGQPEPAGPAVEGAERDEEGGGDHLPDDVLEGQLAGDPGRRRS